MSKSREFWNKGHSEPNTGCLLWPNLATEFGHGRIMHNGKLQMVHRVAYEKYFGAIPSNMFVLHRCDTPSCYNPDHLFLGTKKENRLDQIAKGRDPAKKAKTCKRGHAITGIQYSGRRQCIICYKNRPSAHKGSNA